MQYANVLVFILGLCTLAYAKTPLYVDSHCPDAIGTVVVYNFKEAVGGSSIYRPVQDQRDAVIVHLVCVAADSDASQDVPQNDREAAIGLTITIEKDGREYYIAHAVYTVGRNQASRMGRELLADVDSQVDVYRSRLTP